MTSKKSLNNEKSRELHVKRIWRKKELTFTVANKKTKQKMCLNYLKIARFKGQNS